MSETIQSFEGLLLSSVDSALEKVFGNPTAKAVKFYVDSNIALKNPDAYATSLSKMFGEGGAKVVVDSIVESLCKAVGLDAKAYSSLGDSVRAVRERYRASPPAGG